MTETKETAEEAMTVEVPIKGHIVHMAMPSSEQILVWKRTIRRFENLNTADLNAGQALDAVDRCLNIVTSLIALPEDTVWLEDSLLDKSVTFGDILTLFSDAVEKFAELARQSGNREDRRAAAKPAKKVVRKKAPRKATAR